jgi:hypothetical protein
MERARSSLLQPIYLLADEQLLFWKQRETLFFAAMRAAIRKDNPSATYIGATTEDSQQSYQTFVSAVNALGIYNCRKLSATPTAAEVEFTNQADVIVLDGVDVERDWNILKRNGVDKLIARRYQEGATLIGISAGAIQLGWAAWCTSASSPHGLFHPLQLVPFVIGVSEEDNNWQRMSALVCELQGQVRGFGIPSGGGLIYHASDCMAEPVRYPMSEYTLGNGRLMHNKLFPGHVEDVVEATEVIN